MADVIGDGLNAQGGLPDPEADRQFYDGVPAKRLAAWAVDVIVVWGLLIVALILTLGIGIFFAGFLLLVIDFAYRVLTLSDRSATFGMRALGIELRTLDGDRFTTAHAVLHTVLFYAMFIFFVVQLVSVVLMAGSRFGRGIHDLLIGTTMINRPA